MPRPKDTTTHTGLSNDARYRQESAALQAIIQRLRPLPLESRERILQAATTLEQPPIKTLRAGTGTGH